jgi:hypothetical protein
MTGDPRTPIPAHEAVVIYSGRESFYARPGLSAELAGIRLEDGQVRGRYEGEPDWVVLPPSIARFRAFTRAERSSGREAGRP